MKRLPTGIIIFDTFDIICVSVSFGSTISFLVRRYMNRKKVDPIISELKKEEESSIIDICSKEEPLRLNPILIRGGEFVQFDALINEKLKLLSLAVKSKRLFRIFEIVLTAKKHQKLLKLLQLFLFTFNKFLAINLDICITSGGAMDWTQVIIIFVPSTLGGIILDRLIKNPFFTIFTPLLLMYGRGVEEVFDPRQKCRIICKNAAEFHNKELLIEMKQIKPFNENGPSIILTDDRLNYLKNKIVLENRLKLKTVAEKAFETFEMPLSKGPLICIEEKFSLVQSFKLKEVTGVIRNSKIKKRIQHFNEFIKQFPDCGPDEEIIYEKIIERISK
jgi:hypothetical protein